MCACVSTPGACAGACAGPLAHGIRGQNWKSAAVLELSSAPSPASSRPSIARRAASAAPAGAAADAAEQPAQKRFINDVIRSDFHRAFLRKFVT